MTVRKKTGTPSKRMLMSLVSRVVPTAVSVAFELSGINLISCDEATVKFYCSRN